MVTYVAGSEEICVVLKTEDCYAEVFSGCVVGDVDSDFC
jgi:hypothetical protein